MRTADYLTRYGAMPVEDMGGLESQWPGLSMAQAYEREDLRFDAAADEYARQHGHADARAYHQALTGHVRANGIANSLGLGPAYDTSRFAVSVTNGQHRYFAAVDAGLLTVPAGPNRYEPMPLVPGWDYPADVSPEAG